RLEADAPGATWSYSAVDNVPPMVAACGPPAFVTVASLTQIRVTFSEPVANVTTNDLLVNNRPVRQVSGSGAGPYTFSFLSPSNGLVDMRWAADQDITDLASTPNAFAGGEWSYTFDPNASFAGKILINEIMFDPLGGGEPNEWMEFYNPTTNLINLTGWKIKKGVKLTFAHVAILVRGYLVVVERVARF